MLYHQSIPSDSSKGIQVARSCGAGIDAPGALSGRGHSFYAGARIIKNEEKRVSHGKTGKVSETGDLASGR